eukprot:s1416_g13.t1
MLNKFDASRICGRSPWPDSLHLLEELKHAGQQADVVVLGACINACKKRSCWSWAVELLSCTHVETHVAGASQSSRICCNAVISSLRLRWQLAWSLLERMVQSATSPNEISFNALSSATAPWRDVLALLRSMRRWGRRPDEISFDTVATCLASAHAWSRALQLSSKAETVGQETPSWQQAIHLMGTLGGETGSLGFNASLKAMAAAVAWGMAVGCFSSMTHTRVVLDWRSRMPILSSCSRALMWPRSYNFLQQQQLVKIQPDEMAICAAMNGSTKAQCWIQSLQLCSAVDDLDDLSLAAVCGGHVWRAAIQKKLGWASTTATMMTCDSWDSALALLQFTKDQRLAIGPGSLGAAATAVSVTGKDADWQVAFLTLSLMISEELGINDVSFGSAISSLRNAQLWITALHLLNSMPQRCLQATDASRSAAVAAVADVWRTALSLAPVPGRAEIFGIRCPWQISLHFSQMHVVRSPLDEISRHACLAALELDPGDWQLPLQLFRWGPLSSRAFGSLRAARMTAHLRSGQTMTGMVKSYNRRGFGFIMCQAIEQDIYFSRESLHPNLQTSDLAGEQIQFEIHRFHDGKLQARNLRALGDVSDFKGSSYGANREYGAGVRAQFFNCHRSAGLQDEDRSRDWYCKSCGERNFMKRFECFKCKTPKPPEIGEVQVPQVVIPAPKRNLSPHAGSRAMREMYKQGLLGPAATAPPPPPEPSRSRSRRSASSSSSSSSAKRRKKKHKHKKHKKGKSSSSSSSSRSKSSVRSAEGPKDDEDPDKPKETNPEIEKAKAEALETLMKLKEIESKENRSKEFRALLRKWHPDKNPDQQELRVHGADGCCNGSLPILAKRQASDRVVVVECLTFGNCLAHGGYGP